MKIGPATLFSGAVLAILFLNLLIISGVLWFIVYLLKAMGVIAP